MRGTIIAAAALLGAGFLAPAIAAEPAPPTLEFAFEEQVTLGPAMPVGQTPMGKRNIVPITGGTIKGPNIQGTVVPGGWDWQLTRADGCLTLKADYMLKTDDGTIINVVNTGTGCPGPDAPPLHTTPTFEAPLGKYDWLNKSAFIGTLEVPKGPALTTVTIRFYRVK